MKNLALFGLAIVGLSCSKSSGSAVPPAPAEVVVTGQWEGQWFSERVRGATGDIVFELFQAGDLVNGDAVIEADCFDGGSIEARVSGVVMTGTFIQGENVQVSFLVEFSRDPDGGASGTYNVDDGFQCTTDRGTLSLSKVEEPAELAPVGWTLVPHPAAPRIFFRLPVIGPGR